MKRFNKMLILAGICALCVCMMACGKRLVKKEEMRQENTEQESETADSDKKTDAEKDATDLREQVDEEQANQKNLVAKNGDYILARPSQNGALSVKGVQLVDENCQAVQLRGISTHGIGWFPQFVNSDAITQLSSDFGANVFRIAMYTDENSGYCTDGDKEKLKQLIFDGVDYAKKADMYVIVDWHILHDTNPLIHKDEALQFFDEITEQLKNDKHVIYEICNEPNGDTGWEDVRNYAEEVLSVIRKHAPDAVVLIGTPTWCQEIDKPQKDPVSGYDNIMYTLHFYAATHKENLRNKMIDAVKAGTPVFVSEFGLCDASGNGGNDLTEAQNWIDVMDQYGISYVVWSLCNKDETSALIDSSCQKTFGFEKDDLSESGKWIYDMLHTDGRAGADKQKGAVNEKADQDTNKEQEKGLQTSAVDHSNVKKQSISVGELEVNAEITGSWEAEGKTFYQYQLTVTNKGEEAVSSWEIPLTFSEEIALLDGWNGEYTVDGKKLTIRSKDYNGEIKAGDVVTDIGFIVSASGSLSLE